MLGGVYYSQATGSLWMVAHILMLFYQCQNKDSTLIEFYFTIKKTIFYFQKLRMNTFLLKKSYFEKILQVKMLDEYVTEATNIFF